jgi:hypothetical protein
MNAFLVVVAMLLVAGAAAQPVASAEEVQAAYLHRFAGFVEWPPRAFGSALAPIVVGVAGSEPVFQALSTLAAGRPVQGRTLEVKRVLKPDPGAKLHLVFVGKDAWRDLPAWTAAANEHALLVTTDAPNGVDRGAALAFVRSGPQVRFEASLAAADKAGVRMSARLLGVAERVVGAAR